MSGFLPVAEVRVVGDLTEEHFGWYVTVSDPEIHRRSFAVIGLRRWINDDGPQVGVTTDEGRDRGWAGTEHCYPPDTPCELLRKVKVARRQRQHGR